LSTIFTGILKELNNEKPTEFSQILLKSLSFIEVLNKYNLINDGSVLVPLDIFIEIIKFCINSKKPLLNEHKKLICETINCVTKLTKGQIFEYEKLLIEIIQKDNNNENNNILYTAAVNGIFYYYKGLIKKNSNKIVETENIKKEIIENYTIIKKCLSNIYNPANFDKFKNILQKICDHVDIDKYNEISEFIFYLEFLNSCLLFEKLLIKLKIYQKCPRPTEIELFLCKLKAEFLLIPREFYNKNTQKNMLNSLHLCKFFILPLLQNANISYKLNANLWQEVKIVAKIVEFLNKNDEFIMQKIFSQFLFNSSLFSEFENIKKELISLQEFFKGYTMPNYENSLKIYKNKSNLFTLFQNENESFLPIFEMWLINPALYIDPKGPPSNCLQYYSALLKYLTFEHINFTIYEKMCIAGIILTNYADFIGNPILIESGKFFIEKVLVKEPLIVKYSSKKCENMKMFRLDNLVERLSFSYSEISYNDFVLAQLTIALLQKTVDISIKKKLLSEIKPLISRMCMNFEDFIIGGEDLYVLEKMELDLESLYSEIELILRNSGVSQKNKLYLVFAKNIKNP